MVAVLAILFAGCSRIEAPDVGFAELAGSWSECVDNGVGNVTCKRWLGSHEAHVQVMRLTSVDIEAPSHLTWRSTLIEDVPPRTTKTVSTRDGVFYGVYVWFEPPLQPAVHDHFAARLLKGVTVPDLEEYAP